ncbi:MAG: hypothetical protein KF795_29160 [Labilithrix sp.]|nr:hypothetical protein [Labilithrix sp.]
MRSLLPAIVGAVLVCATPAARGEPRPLRCSGRGPAVNLRTIPLEGTLRARFLSQLGAALSAREIDVCDDDRVVAVVDIETKGDEIRIVASDVLFDKRVERTIDVAAMPTDGLPLMLALATDELLRAAWAELLVAGAPASKKPVPSEIRRAVGAPAPEAGLAPPPAATSERAARAELGAQAAGEVFGGGQQQLGGDLVAGYWMSPRAGIHGSLGGRLGLPAMAPRGEVRSTAVPIAVGARLALTDPRRALGLDLAVRTTLVPVHFVSEARPPARGRERTAVAFVGGAAVRGTLATSPSVFMWLEVGVGVTLRAVEARDGLDPVTGLSGVMVGANAGVSTKL